MYIYIYIYIYTSIYIYIYIHIYIYMSEIGGILMRRLSGSLNRVPSREREAADHRLADRVGTKDFFHRRATHFILFAMCRLKCAHVATFCSHFPTEVPWGESRHFCDDLVCLDPVRKLSKKHAIYGYSCYHYQ